MSAVVPRNEEGFTLVELLAVVVIIAVLAMVAVPAMTRESMESGFRKAAREVAQDLQSARFEAGSSREDRRLHFTTATTYSVRAVIGGASGLVKQVTLRPEAVIQGVALCTAVSGIVCAVPGSFAETSVHFGSTQEVAACAGAGCTPDASSATVFLKSADGAHQSRIVVYSATGYIRSFDGW